jgi:hypothetical protein
MVIETDGVRTQRRRILQQSLLSFFLLEFQSVGPLQMAFGRLVIVGRDIFFKCRKEISEATDLSCPPILRRVICRCDPSKRRARRKEREEVWWELGRHLAQ